MSYPCMLSQPGYGSDLFGRKTIAQLCLEADNATARAEEAEAKYKRLEQEVMTQCEKL